jgi:tRNA threonylcarbamoyl adenosine modification protein YeaZ
MSILAIDTSDTITYIAVRNVSSNLYSNAGFVDQQASHNEELGDLLIKTLEESGTKLSEVNTLIVGSGPGSFTGLRIGYGFIKGLAVGLKIPIIEQCSFEAAFFDFCNSIDFKDNLKRVSIISDARRNQFFKKSFNINDQKFKLGHSVIIGDCDLTQRNVEDAIVRFNNLAEVPMGADKYFNVRNLGLGHIHLYDHCLAMGLLDSRTYDMSNLHKLCPNYVRQVNAQTIMQREKDAMGKQIQKF